MPVFNIFGCCTHGEEFQEQPVLPVTELELEDPIRPHLLDQCHSACFQTLAQLSDEDRGGSGCCSRKVGQMAAETSVDEHLFLVLGFRELEK